MANGKISPYIKAQLHRWLCTRNIFGKRRSFQAAPFLHDTDPCVKTWGAFPQRSRKMPIFFANQAQGFPRQWHFSGAYRKSFRWYVLFFSIIPLFFRCPIPNLYVSFPVLHVQPKTFTSGISACFGIVFLSCKTKKTI